MWKVFMLCHIKIFAIIPMRMQASSSQTSSFATHSILTEWKLQVPVGKYISFDWCHYLFINTIFGMFFLCSRFNLIPYRNAYAVLACYTHTYMCHITKLNRQFIDFHPKIILPVRTNKNDAWVAGSSSDGLCWNDAAGWMKHFYVQLWGSHQKHLFRFSKYLHNWWTDGLVGFTWNYDPHSLRQNR